jgi:hypothetical protein
MELQFVYRVIYPIHLIHAGEGDYVIRRIGDRPWPLSLMRHFGPEAVPYLQDRAEIVAVQWAGDWYDVLPSRPPLRVLSLRRRWATPEVLPIGDGEHLFQDPPDGPALTE